MNGEVEGNGGQFEVGFAVDLKRRTRNAFEWSHDGISHFRAQFYAGGQQLSAKLRCLRSKYEYTPKNLKEGEQDLLSMDV